MNTYQLKTTKGKPIINNVGLPIFNLPINMRLKNAKKALGLDKPQSFDDRWNRITQESNKLLTFKY